MIVTYNERHKMFIAHTRPEDKEVPKSAGFLWDREGRFPGGRNVWKTKFASRAMRLYDLCDDKAKKALNKMKQGMEQSRATNAAIKIPSPEGLEYLPYQKAGIAYALKRKGTLIADEMGLGKTVEALGFINAKNDRAGDQIHKVIIICPASLRILWRREAEKWLVNPYQIHTLKGKEKPNPEKVAAGVIKIYIAGYQYLATGHLDHAKPDLLIVDEAHNVKNPKAQRTINIFALALRSTYKLFLTGSPLLNKPIELHPIASHLSPKNFGYFMAYTKRYCGAHEEKRNGSNVWIFDGATHLDELQDKLRASIMIRRLKGDVLSELPPKRRSIIPVEAKWNDPDTVQKYIEALDALDVQMARDGADESAKAYKLAIRSLKEEHQIAFEKMSAYRRDTAIAKIPGSLQYITNMLQSGVQKVIVFAHHHQVIEQLTAGLKKYGVVTFYGKTSEKKRDQAVQQFQNDSDIRVFVGGIQAAGVGLTLTAAHHVVQVESDWVPATITQGEDRAHRIGQHDIVFVHQIVVDGTLDARMAKKIIKKQEIADAALDTIHETLQAPSGTSDPRTEPRKSQIPEEKKNALLQALRSLSGVCDGAQAKDDTGFNGFDSGFGKSLAAREFLTDSQYKEGYRLISKYHRQIDTSIKQILGINY